MKAPADMNRRHNAKSPVGGCHRGGFVRIREGVEADRAVASGHGGSARENIARRRAIIDGRGTRPAVPGSLRSK